MHEEPKGIFDEELDSIRKSHKKGRKHIGIEGRITSGSTNVTSNILQYKIKELKKNLEIETLHGPVRIIMKDGKMVE